MDLKTVEFDRQYRTPSSEGYSLRSGRQRVARLDVHFTTQSVYGTLVLLRDLAEGDIPRLVERINESVVLSAETPREDFYVTVFRGTEVGFFSDDFQANQGREVEIRPSARLDRELIDGIDDQT